MTILPLIERELRVRARSRAVYWTRFAVVLVGLLLCVPTLLAPATPWGGTQAMMGQRAFSGLIVMAFFLCCCACLLTADNISRELRDGTLGLLFLTRVRVFDVLLGAFGSAGITCVCALIACLPVLILPLLTGGVTGGEALRKILVLFDTLFLSLAVGLLASAGGRGWFKSARAAVILLLALLIVPGFSGSAWLGPIGALKYSDDVLYRAYGGRYWSSVGFVHVISWLLLLAAGLRLRWTMGREGTEERSRSTATRLVRPLQDGVDPILWLMHRQWGIKATIWTATILQAAYLSMARLMYAWIHASQGLSMAISLVEGCLFAWAASHFLVEARRTGELELLLTTPLGAREVIAMQWKWMKRLLRLPLVVLAAPVAFTALYWTWNVSSPMRFTPISWSVMGCANIVASTLALFRVGLWQGFKARSQASAVIWTVILVQGVSYLISLPLRLFGGLVRFSGQISLGYELALYFSPVVVLSYYIWLIRWSKRRLESALKPACA